MTPRVALPAKTLYHLLIRLKMCTFVQTCFVINEEKNERFDKISLGICTKQSSFPIINHPENLNIP